MRRKSIAQLQAEQAAKKSGNANQAYGVPESGGIPEDIINEAESAANDSSEQAASEGVLAIVENMNEEHFIAPEGGKVPVFKESYDYELDRPKLEVMSRDAFSLLHGNHFVTVKDENGQQKRLPVPRVWLSHEARRTYEKGLALIPNGEVPDGVYNLWRGFGCDSVEATETDVSIMLSFIYLVICAGDRKAANYLLKWLARSVQYPALQAEVAIVLLGGKGIGKGFFGRMVRDLFGAHGMHILHSRHLTGNFNAHLRNCLFMFVDESFFVGDKAGNNVLKGLITEDQMAVEKKGIDVFSVRNRLKIVMATNELHAVLASGDERRFCVLQVSESKKQDHDYFAELDQWWRNGGMAKFLGYLLKVDISNFNIRLVPNTAALEQQKIASLEPFDAWIYERLKTADWKTEISCSWFAEEFRNFIHADNLRHVKTTTQAVGALLHRRLEVHTKQQTTGTRARVWVLPELDEARRQFADSLGLVLTGWDEDE